MRLDPLGLRLRPRFPSLQVLTRPTFCVTTSPARSRTWTCFFMPVSVIWNLSARRVIDASPRAKLIDDPAAGRIGQRRKREIEGRTCILNHIVQCLACSRRKRKRPELSVASQFQFLNFQTETLPRLRSPCSLACHRPLSPLYARPSGGLASAGADLRQARKRRGSPLFTRLFVCTARRVRFARRAPLRAWGPSRHAGHKTAGDNRRPASRQS